jgi:hypothetical protein
MFWFLLVIAFLRFQVVFLTIFVLPIQGFFNALIYFDVTIKPRRGSIPEHTTRSSSFFVPPFRRWGFSFSRRCSSAASTDPKVTVVVRAAQEEEFKDFEEENPVTEQNDTNGDSEEWPIPSIPVGMELHSRTVPEASLEH